MNKYFKPGITTAAGLIEKRPAIAATILLAVNLLLRLLVYGTTTIFSYSDYSVYLKAVDEIAEGKYHYLQVGNFMFALSYIGYFSRYLLGSLDWFYIFNCIAGTFSGLVMYRLISKLTESPAAGLMTIILLTVYTEFMVFSSVFYTPVIMILLVSLLLLSLYHFITGESLKRIIFPAILIILFFLLTFFFKPELKYFPWIILISGILFLRGKKSIAVRLIILSSLLMISLYTFNRSGIISKPEGNVISNSFIFFGHTDYGGDGGEGAFIYPENARRFDEAFNLYCKENNIAGYPSEDIYNEFRKSEMKRFITEHPLKWTMLQARKFFSTFGMLPESTSFRVLWSGMMQKSIFLTSIVIVSPVALIILLFIFFFNRKALRKILNEDNNGGKGRAAFFAVWMIIFFYYIIATIFYGQYQERYRMPLMVLFIIPLAAWFTALALNRETRSRIFSAVKIVITAIFLTIWIIQASEAGEKRERLQNLIETTLK